VIAGVPSKRRDERDCPSDVLVELVKFFGGNPQLVDAGTSHPLRRKPLQIHGFHIEAQDVSDVP
jgi:hypothetical protein